MKKTKLKQPTCRVCKAPQRFKDLTTFRGAAKDGIVSLEYECRKRCEPPAEPLGIAVPTGN